MYKCSFQSVGRRPVGVLAEGQGFPEVWSVSRFDLTPPLPPPSSAGMPRLGWDAQWVGVGSGHSAQRYQSSALFHVFSIVFQRRVG